MYAKKLSSKGKSAQAGPSGSSGISTVPSAPQPPQIEEPPKWAKQLFAAIESIDSRIGSIEAGANRPNFSEVASEVSDGGVDLTGTPKAVQPSAAKQRKGDSPQVPKDPPQPKMGESGSGYTLLPNGKMVRNKRPAHKPLPVRQAINWRGNATTELVSFLKEKGIGKSDIKPVGDPVYDHLVEDLAKAKAYYAYTKNGGTLQVHVWRDQHKDEIFSSPPEEEAQSWADEVNESTQPDAPVAAASATAPAEISAESLLFARLPRPQAPIVLDPQDSIPSS